MSLCVHVFADAHVLANVFETNQHFQQRFRDETDEQL